MRELDESGSRQFEEYKGRPLPPSIRGSLFRMYLTFRLLVGVGLGECSVHGWVTCLYGRPGMCPRAGPRGRDRTKYKDIYSDPTMCSTRTDDE